MEATTSLPITASASAAWKSAARLWVSVVFHLAADLYWLVAFGI